MKNTNTILDKIIATKKKSLSEAKQLVPELELRGKLKSYSCSKKISFYDALKYDQNCKIIAEIKKSSPSSGLLWKSFDLKEINDAYQSSASVAAVSVITEEDYFNGSLENLQYVASNNTGNKPILRKDFIFDTYQIIETKLIGAHAYLLIASLFSIDDLIKLVDAGLALDLEPLVEVTSQQELTDALKTNARCIGVNSRDLKTFKTDKKKHELLRQLDPSYVRVAESAINDADYLQYLGEFTDAALIGSYFMKSEDISSSIRSLAKPGSKI